MDAIKWSALLFPLLLAPSNAATARQVDASAMMTWGIAEVVRCHIVGV